MERIENNTSEQSKTSQFFGWVERNQKLVIVILVFLFIRLLLKGKKEPIKPQGGKDENVLEQNTAGATLTDAQALSKAEQLDQAMNSVFGTDEDVIYDVLKGLSLADYNKVYNAFGIRYYNVALGAGANFSWLGRGLDLNGWLVYELTPSEMKQLKKLNPNLPF